VTRESSVESVFIIEQYLPHPAATEVEAFASALGAAASRINTPATPVRLACSILVPEDELCLHLLTAASAEAAAQAAEAAAITVERIVTATAWFGS
jgi:hypothetical protein